MATEQEQLVASIEAYLLQHYSEASLTSMRKLFDRYDRDGDGKINKQELGQLLKDIDIGNALTRSAWVRGIIDKLDSNHDNSIAWDEFHNVIGLTRT